MKTTCLLSLALIGLGCAVSAQELPALKLWAGDAPGARGKADHDTPTLTPYLPPRDQATGAAVVICPGGAYGMLASHEGRDYALWLNHHGIAGFVLKYRLGTAGYRHPAMLHDAARAVRTVRARAADWGLDPKRVGIMGSSAGGHLAATLLTHFDAGDPTASDPVERESSRPDLGILCYAVISMGPHGHGGSRDNLLGRNPPADLVQLLSNELQVTKDTPPCFLWHTWEDKGVKVENSIEFALALNRANVPFEIHVYEKGGHGLGLGTREMDPTKWHDWTRACVSWMKVRGFLR